MNKLMAVALVWLVTLGPALAQDWRDIDGNGVAYNCELVETLSSEYGEENIRRTDGGEVTSLAELLASLFFDCLDDPPSEDEMEVVWVLYDKVSHEWGTPECSILIDDYFDENFTFAIAGHRLDGLALDVYLPGESEPVEMDRVVDDVLQSGVPLRTAWLLSEEFPLGNYRFDVHIDDETFQFAWQRADDSMNTLSLSCLGRDAERDPAEDAVSETEAAAGDNIEAVETGEAADAIYVMGADEVHRFEHEGCVLTVDPEPKEDFNLTIIGADQDGLSIDVYLPGETEPSAMDGVHTYEQDFEFITLPARFEWIEGDSFPLGEYRFDVQIGESSHQIRWQRDDHDQRAIALICFGAGGLIPELKVLGDDESTFIPETDCLIWTEAWSTDLNVIIAGESQDQMSVALYFPDDDEPIEMDLVNSGQFDSGMPYRVEWLTGETFPIGLYNIDVTIESELYQYQWQREDQSVNTFGVECVTTNDE